MHEHYLSVQWQIREVAAAGTRQVQLKHVTASNVMVRIMFQQLL
jgi:hypothetical protein